MDQIKVDDRVEDVEVGRVFRSTLTQPDVLYCKNGHRVDEDGDCITCEKIAKDAKEV